MRVKVFAEDLPKSIRVPVANAIQATLSENDGPWTVFITSDPRNNAWDVEVAGPQRAHWERRFSGEDRDGEVIAEAIRSATQVSGQHPAHPAWKNSKDLRDALSQLAVQGIAFLKKVDETGQTFYVVDRVELKESEIVYLHHQRALTRRGIPTYLLTRHVA